MQPLSQVTLKAPATSANLGPGFDVFGLALDYPTDQVTLTVAPNRKRGVWIKISGVQAETISTKPERNTAGVVANYMIKEFSLNTDLIIKIKKGIWPSKGLGSSAASAAAVAYGINHLFKLRLTTEQIIQFAAKGEVASAGTEHADNVSAAVCGDFVILKSLQPLEIVNLKAPPDMEVCAAVPHMVTPRHKTAKARLVLPRMVTIRKLTQNVGNAASLVSGFARGDVDLIGRSMVDEVVEPARAKLVPGYHQVRENALKAGACGVTISGAGPTMLAVVNKRSSDAAKVAEAMKEGFKGAGFEATAFVTRPGRGVRLLES
ncbi:MAG: homoserine kinase [Candidatus Bathyarchaeota archaeon]|nr:homoserine kinase [Candidatus Bathyarchaeota archaeon]